MLEFAEDNIGQYITFYLTAITGLAVFVSTKTYSERFNKYGKILLTIGCMVVAAHNLRNIIYYHDIYNAVVIQLNQYYGMMEQWAPLFDTENGAFQQKPIWRSIVGHIFGDMVAFGLIWWRELLHKGQQCKNWLKKGKA